MPSKPWLLVSLQAPRKFPFTGSPTTTTSLLFMPTAFTLVYSSNLLEVSVKIELQMKTLTHHALEQVEMHVFGIVASLGLTVQLLKSFEQRCAFPLLLQRLFFESLKR